MFVGLVPQRRICKRTAAVLGHYPQRNGRKMVSGEKGLWRNDDMVGTEWKLPADGTKHLPLRFLFFRTNFNLGILLESELSPAHAHDVATL